MSNTNKISFYDKKEKKSLLIHTIYLVIICMLLLKVISVSYYFLYKKTYQNKYSYIEESKKV